MLLLFALFGSPGTSQAGVMFSVLLNGASESPPNTSSGTGTAWITFDEVAHTLQIQTSFSGLGGATTAAHIHAPTAVAGEGNTGIATQTPSLIGFPLGVMSGSYDRTFDLTEAASFSVSFLSISGGTPDAAEQALLAAALGGKAYLNIHTTLYPGGEIRGFLQPVPEPSTLAIFVSLIGGLSAQQISRRAGFRRKRTVGGCK